MDINQLEDFSKAPYFDSFDKTKNYVKILFQPGRNVQNQELIGMQSMLQDQINSIGTHLFKNGSMVIPGTPVFNNTVSYVFVDKVDTDTTMADRLIGKYLTETVDLSTNTFLRAHVENVVDLGNKAVVLIGYQNSANITVAGELVNKTTFSANTELNVEDSTEVLLTSTTSNSPSDTPIIGKAATLSVGAGVYWIDGYFVHTPEQRIVVGYNNPNLNIKAGFIVNKSIVTSYDDETLFDNANGTNEAAPGADRFCIELKLSTLELSDEETNFIELIRLENGNLRVSNVNPQYNVLEDTLARRTYDESGDYAVHGFDVKMYEDLKDESNPNGFLTAEKGGDSNLFVAEVSKGKGYVKGYEAENHSNYFLEISKARTPECEKTANDVIQVNEYGDYVFLAPGNQYFDISKHPVIWLTNGQESTAEVIGYCIPKYMDSVQISGQTIFKLYGTFQLLSTTTFSWQHLGGWRLNQLKNGPVLQRLNLTSVVSNFNVTDGQPLTSHVGYTPYAWDSTNGLLYVKKTYTAPVFDRNRAVTKGSASGYVTTIDYRITGASGAGELFKLALNNIKTIKDSVGNVEIQSDVAWNGILTTNASGYAEINHLGDGVFVGQPVAANTGVDNAYFDNLVSIENSGKRLVINNVNYPNSSFAISAELRKPITIKSKTLTEGTTLITAASNRKMILSHKDIYRIKHIYASSAADVTPTDSDDDLKAYYDLVSNDTIDFYFNSAIKAKNGVAIPAGQLLVVYDYFLHGTGDAFSVDSYIALRDNITDDADVTHIGRIPLFTTKEQSYVLSDYLDFRKSVRQGFFMIRATVSTGSPNITVPDDYRNAISVGSKLFAKGFEDGTATVVSVNSTTIVASENSAFSGTVDLIVNAPNAEIVAEPFATSQTTWSAISDSTVTFDATYFVDRYDRIVINRDAEIYNIYGVPGTNTYPDVPADSMSLAVVRVPAYTRNANQIVYSKDDNRRYTMRDIGKLDRRITNLEYYTTLTLKELETKEMKILDADGLDRFKSGLFVANFRDFGVFNPFSEETEYKATLVPETRTMIPLEYSHFVPVELNVGESSNYRVIGDKIFMPFAERVEIEQPYATHYQTLNPYLIVEWEPELVLSPSVDNWIETEWAPVITNVTNLVNNVSSSTTVVGETTTVYVDLPPRVVSGYYGAGNAPPADTVNTTARSSTTSTREIINTSTTNAVSESDYKLLGSAVIPLARSIEVHFAMKGGKPSTRFWVRFDNIDVTNHCCPYNPETDVRGSFGEALVSDPMGELHGIFLIPPATFKTGDRVIELSDVNLDTEPDALVECHATATYTSNGTLQTMQEIVNTINTTTNSTVTQTTLNTTITISRQPVTYVNLGDRPVPPPRPRGDPLAQSFFTSDVQGPGMFVTKVDVYFAKKDYYSPAFLELKEVVNGQPANGRVANSLTLIDPEDVVVSDDSTVPSTFYFDEPIYLQADREYAFVVGSNSAKYAVWVARMGEKIINENRVLSEQPSLGSLFKSQNNSTWTAYQLEDVKFRIHRAQFNASQETVLVFNNTDSGSKRKIDASMISTVSGSNLVRIYHPNHGTLVNEFVELIAEDGIGIAANSPLATDSFNGVLMSNIYGSKLVKEVHSINEYSIEIPVNATVTGNFEVVGKYLYAKSNVNYHNYRLGMNAIIPDKTSVTYTTELITGKDFDGGQTPQVIMPESSVKNNENNALADVGLVQIPDNESNRKSMIINTRFFTGSDYVSPILFTNSNGVTIASSAINKPSVDDETLANGGSVNSKAVSQIVRLTTLSNSIRIYTAENKQYRDDFDVYVRTASDRDIESKAWVKVEATKQTVQVDTSTYIEHERILNDVLEFDEYQVKLVFKGTDSTHYPSINDLRIITVAT